ncbi:MAG: hypothetical protein LQ337_002039 [Flavoplaca oasis]|nr:MAG: hypothetical protein LQ337_002039 [Flavoplaca oasis]
MQGSQNLPQTISSRIETTVQQHPELLGLFQDIITHISTLTRPTQTNGNAPSSKKRKLEVEPSTADTFDSIADISFSIPQRKKLKLEISRNSETGAIRGANATTGEADFGIRYSDVDTCICLPVPEKAQPQYSFCILPTSGDEQLLFSVPGTKIRPEAVHTDQPLDEEQSYKDVVMKMLNKRLKKTKVVEPNEKDFASTITQPHRKGEKAVHVKAFRGSKDGIIFTFKKPLLYYPFHSIASISYTSVLQRTFNLNLNVYTSSSFSSSPTNIPPATENSTHEIEFSMIDQADFSGIDTYIKRHNLQDASMAEQRRAQKYNINGTTSSAKNDNEGGEGAEEGELQKAQREAQDMEDEEEDEDENFDPGSEGESEGSGSGSEEEDEDGGNVDADGNLVEMELGSEAEDVSE